MRSRLYDVLALVALRQRWRDTRGALQGGDITDFGEAQLPRHIARVLQLRDWVEP